MPAFFARFAATAAAMKVAATKATTVTLMAMSAMLKASPELLSSENGFVHGRHDVLLEFCKLAMMSDAKMTSKSLAGWPSRPYDRGFAN